MLADNIKAPNGESRSREGDQTVRADQVEQVEWLKHIK